MNFFKNMDAQKKVNICFVLILLTTLYATMKFWWRCEDGNMRMAGRGQQNEDGCIRLAVAEWWHHNNGVMMVVLNFH